VIYKLKIFTFGIYKILSTVIQPFILNMWVHLCSVFIANFMFLASVMQQ